MASNLANQSRNVLSKKLMVKKEVILHFDLYFLDNYGAKIYWSGNSVSFVDQLQSGLSALII